ncbi:MAG: MOSC domain-containing protein [Thaumarchaeota archaeon]|nr:MOSC domain-containing protein [Nitrososphaerota archaeon]
MAVQESEVTARESGAPIGSVSSVLRYPVKSMLGEEIDASYVTDRGLLGDRAYALVDKASGKVASAKNPRKWGRLFDFRASFVDPPRVGENLPAVRITFPDGSSTTSVKPGVDDLLSKALGAEVQLMPPSLDNPSYEEYWPDIEGRVKKSEVTDESMPPRTFFDAAPVHLLTTATTDHLHEFYPQGRFEAKRFRPNIVVEPSSAAKGFVEEGWIGRTLHLGAEVRLRVTGPCKRCVMTTLPQGDLPQDLGILRTAARYNQVKVGVYASVEKGGQIRRGDSVWMG